MNFPRRPIHSAIEGVRVVNLDRIAPGEFGRVRTQQLDTSLPLQPASSDELKAMIATRNAVLAKPGGYANLPVRLTPQQQQNLNAKLGDSLGEMNTKFYVAPGGEQGMSFKKPWVDRPASPPPDELGQVAFKTAYGEMPITLNRNQGEVMMPNDYPQHELGNRDMKQSDMMSTRQMIGSLNANSAAERVELTDRLQRGGFDVSTANQMAEENYLDDRKQGGLPLSRVRYPIEDIPGINLDAISPTVTRHGGITALPVQTWTNNDIAEFEPLGAAGMSQRVDSPDALFSTWKQTPSQSAQMERADILRGTPASYNEIHSGGNMMDLRGSFGTDVRDLKPPMNPLYTVNRPGMKIVNSEYLSSTPNRVIPLQQKIGEMVNADGSITPLYKTMKGNHALADILMQEKPARPVEQVPMVAPGEIYSTDRETVNVPPAFQLPAPLPTRGGHDITTESNTRQFPDETWGNTNLEVMLPSTILADKGLSPYLLTQNSQIPTKELGRQRYSDSVYYDRMEADRMIDTNPHADYVTERGGQFYEPMQDSRSVLDRLEASQRRAKMPYVSDRNRVQSRYPKERIQEDVMGRSILRDLPAADQAVLGDALRGGFGESFRKMNPDYVPSNSPKPTEEMLSQLVNRYAPVREYDNRVQLAKDAINDGYQKLGTMPDVEPTRITTMVPNGSGYDQIVDTENLSVAQRLNESRDFQERGYGQATMGLPKGATVETENVNSLLVFPHNKQATSDTGVNRVTKNGSLQEVYPLDDRQKAQFETEIAAGQRKVMPVGTTQPGISMANEILEEGVPLGRAANLPITRLNMTTEDAGNYSAPFVQERFAVDDAEKRSSSGMRLRGQRPLPVADDPISETERAIAAYRTNQRRQGVIY